MRISRLAGLVLLVSLPLCVPCPAADKEYKSAALDGTTGLFTVWDAEALKSGEANVGFAVNRYNLDPGQLEFTRFPVSAALGAFGVIEVFGAFDVQKRVEAGSIATGRIGPGEVPRPAETPLGLRLNTNEALYIDRASASGRGDIRGGIKVNVLSERRNNPIGLAGVIFGRFPTRRSYESLNLGLSSSTVTGSFGALVSKRFASVAQLHANFLVNLIRSPRGELAGFEEHPDVGHEFVYRAGLLLPNRGRLHFIGEVAALVHSGDRTPGLNPVDPVDVLLGVRAYPNPHVSLSAGYRLSANTIDEDPARQIFGRGRHGFVVQLALGLRTD